MPAFRNQQVTRSSRVAGSIRFNNLWESRRSALSTSYHIATAARTHSAPLRDERTIARARINLICSDTDTPPITSAARLSWFRTRQPRDRRSPFTCVFLVLSLKKVSWERREAMMNVGRAHLILGGHLKTGH